MGVMRSSNLEFKALMDSVGWTAAETARRIDVTEASISGYLSGKTEPPRSKIELLRLKIIEFQNSDANASDQPSSSDNVAGGAQDSPKSYAHALEMHIAANARGIVGGFPIDQKIWALDEIVRASAQLRECLLGLMEKEKQKGTK